MLSSVHLKAESETVNVLHTPGGLTMLMICARNGTIGFANYVKGLASLSGTSFGDMADRLTDLAAKLPLDAHGVQLVPFFQGENVAELPHARASVHNAGIEYLANPSIMARLLLEGPCMTMRYGIERLRPKVGNLRRVVLSGRREIKGWIRSAALRRYPRRACCHEKAMMRALPKAQLCLLRIWHSSKK